MRTYPNRTQMYIASLFCVLRSLRLRPRFHGTSMPKALAEACPIVHVEMNMGSAIAART